MAKPKKLKKKPTIRYIYYSDNSVQVGKHLYRLLGRWCDSNIWATPDGKRQLIDLEPRFQILTGRKRLDEDLKTDDFRAVQ